MPEPKTNETKQEFMDRCVPYLIKQEERERDQAVAICNKYWDESRRGNSMADVMANTKRYWIPEQKHEEFPVACGSKWFAGKNEGTEIQRFRKDMIQVGVYEHPFEGFVLDVTEDRLYQWVATFKRMRENGIDIEVPLDHSLSAADNLGYVVDMFVEENPEGIPTLYGIHEIRGKDAIEVVRRNKNISVLIERDFVDGKGHSYGEAITHSSVVQKPVVPSKEEFEEYDGKAASKIPMLALSNNYDQKSRGQKMDKEKLEQLKNLLGAGDDVTEDNIIDRVSERLSALKKEKNDLEEKLSVLEGKVEKLEKNADSSGGSDKSASIDADLLEERADIGSEKLNLLVEKGHVTKACADKLSKVLVGESGKRNTLSLSKVDSGKTLLSEICDALSENKALDMGEKSRRQTLDRTSPDDSGTADDQERKEIIANMAEGAGVSLNQK